MESKPTPGPWRVSDQVVACATLVVSDHDPLVASVGDYRTQYSRSRNAHLIAAAPEMFEALEAYEAFSKITDPNKMPGALEEFKVKAAQALKKARGPR